ncbi:MAG: hypothetical protein ACQES2_09300 [Pseudomonadota bacterium]
MSKSQLELGDGTLRQRRNLLLITSLLVFMHHGKVAFGTDVKIFGASASIGNPSFILQFLFLIQAYFLWRFYQYFNADGAYFKLKSQFHHTLTNKLDSSTLQQIFKELPAGMSSLSGSYSYNNLEGYDSNFFQIEVEVLNSNGGFENEKFSVRVPKAPIKRQHISALIGFIFRGRILTDFFLPYLLVAYSIIVYLV